MDKAPTLLWFRDDLRIKDHQALEWLAGQGPVTALYVLDTSAATRPLGRASAWWLHHSLKSLATDLQDYDIRLQVRSGDPLEIVPDTAHKLGASAVAWTRRYHQPWCQQDATIKEGLNLKGINARSFAGHLLLEPWEVSTNTGGSYQVYTPFSRKALELLDFEALEGTGGQVPQGLSGTGADLEKTTAEIESLALTPELRAEPSWAKDFPFQPGEAGAWQLAQDFVPVGNYQKDRDFPAKPATSRLSPHLRFGEISVSRLYALVGNSPNALVFRKELLWRDFAWHRLYHNPHMVNESLREKFRDFPWWRATFRADDIYQGAIDPDSELGEFAAWALGKTGIPLVDAGMRELNATATMHNRVRMVVGSLLTKNLGIHWKMGEEWFWDTLVDADLASNTFNWQWVAGCGDDAAPYFRIFNPLTQQKRFDPEQSYCKQWVQELNTPFYPQPIVDLGTSRKAALDAYQSL